MIHFPDRWEPIKYFLRGIIHSLYFPPAVICIAVLSVTVWTWSSTRQSLQEDLNAAITRRVSGAEEQVRNRLASYEEILQGGVGLFQASDEVTRLDWKRYADAFNIALQYPGVQGIGYAQIIERDEVSRITEYMQSQGMENFAIYPETPGNSDHAAVLYLQPERAASAKAFGFDMFTEPVRRDAMWRAQDTNRPILTGRITLISNNSSVDLTGFNMYMPYYRVDTPISTVEQRRSALVGYVYAAFRSNIFFNSIAKASDDDKMAFRVNVASSGNPTLYESHNFPTLSSNDKTVQVVRPLNLYGQTWDIQYLFNRDALVSKAQLNAPAGVLVVGIFTALSIALIVWLLLRARANELMIQKEQDVELAKDELLSLASHQLRTPATGVKQYLGMVLQGFAGEVSEEQRPLLEKAYSSNDRQLHVINEILHLAKIDAGRIVIARQDTVLNDLIADIVHEQRSDIDTAGHTIAMKLPKKPIEMNIDAHMLRMAVENLVSNAIKYTPRGGTITVKLRKDRNHVYITVRDNGVGIARDDFSKLFRQFSRLPNEMSQVVGGTGVGLYLAKHLVELQHGSISVRSLPGKGATFTITLPLESN
ncbi:MAG TPA: CHASE domain-containing protein [Candidatus Saccharimonadales bacterium]|nr:CHASE domain-containing protein [Candidatus Saccharimonadales bacterium]